MGSIRSRTGKNRYCRAGLAACGGSPEWAGVRSPGRAGPSRGLGPAHLDLAPCSATNSTGTDPSGRSRRRRRFGSAGAGRGRRWAGTGRNWLMLTAALARPVLVESGRKWHPEDAEAEFQQALDGAERLVQEHPQVTLTRHHWRRNSTSRTHAGNQRPARAEESFEGAVEIAGNLARSHPKTKNYQYMFANNLFYLGQNSIHAGRLPQAEETRKRRSPFWRSLCLTIPRMYRSPSFSELHTFSTRKCCEIDVTANPHWSGRALRSDCSAPSLPGTPAIASTANCSGSRSLSKAKP